MNGQQGEWLGHSTEAIPARRFDGLRSGAVIRRAAPYLAPALIALLGASCATGDGTTIKPPAPGQTAPPPTTAESEDDTLPSAPITTAVPATGGATISIPPDADTTTFAVFAPWADGAPIEEIYTCRGLDISPPVSWTGLPEDTEEVAVVMVDETTVQRGQFFVHWAVTGLRPRRATLIEGRVPASGAQAINYYGTVGYNGPCPPPEERHDYLLTVHALSERLDLPDGTPADDVIDAIEAATIESVTVVGSVRN